MRNEELRIRNFLSANSTIEPAASGCVETRSRRRPLKLRSRRRPLKLVLLESSVHVLSLATEISVLIVFAVIAFALTIDVFALNLCAISLNLDGLAVLQAVLKGTLEAFAVGLNPSMTLSKDGTTMSFISWKNSRVAKPRSANLRRVTTISVSTRLRADGFSASGHPMPPPFILLATSTSGKKRRSTS